LNTTSFYWFDYETFGTHPAWDRPCQFAGIRTDMDLNIIGDPLMIYCQQAADYLPHPVACKVTGISPDDANQKGEPEAVFIKRILDELATPGTCALGYNNIRFDDEFTRHTLFRNFFDPYEHEWKNDNSRWDLLDVVRLTRALRPQGIIWPNNDEGRATNSLEQLTSANNIQHAAAHDALSDVMATIDMARLIKSTQPRLFNYAFAHKDKHSVAQILNVRSPEPCLHVSGMIPGSRYHISPVMALQPLPGNRNSIIVLDLYEDPTPLLSLSVEQITHRLYESAEQLAAEGIQRLGLRTIKINKCPVLVPMSTLRDEDASRLGIDLGVMKEHQRIAKALYTDERLQTIASAMTGVWPQEDRDVDGSLYSGGFLSADDKLRLATLRSCEPHQIEAHSQHFEDPRLVELAWRYQARNFPKSLNAAQQAKWLEHCHERLLARRR